MNNLARLQQTTSSDRRVRYAAGAAVDPRAESIIYMCALIADRPRAIDRYIDYFGDRR